MGSRILGSGINMASDNLTVVTDQPDYAPGSTAYFTVTNMDFGATIDFSVAHITDPGADGILGTADDTLAYDISGTGNPVFSVTDGGDGDLDGVADGVITVSWAVGQDA